ncbi:replication factor C large subunit [Candidatus Pacearchaeota archaeon]|nr:replication factor C large subunit [Candidatus Pacearchaeota archaeon]
MPWAEKHRPKLFSELKGQEEAIRKIVDFTKNFNSEKSKKALLLHGAPGVGKTTLAYVLANELNFEIFELNASDFRSREKLNEILRPAIEQQSFSKKSKIILIDEVDGISAYNDFGGLPELIYLIKNTNYPIIITANQIWDRKFNDLRTNSEMVKMKDVDYKTIKSLLIDILRKEGKFIDEKTLTEIAVKSRGDIRAAINDIQTESGVKSEEKIPIAERNKETDIFNSLKVVFKGNPKNETLEVFDSVNMELDEIMLWIEKNIPSEYKGEELARAFDLLSRADVFKGRIYKQQYWRFLLYENIFLSYGISASKNPRRVQGNGFTTYKRPDRILKIWMNNKRTEKQKSIAKKYAKYTHIGEKRAMRDFPVIKVILKNPEAQKEIKLNEEEIEYLMK